MYTREKGKIGSAPERQTKEPVMKGLSATLRALLILAVLFVAGVGAAIYVLAGRGWSARAEPGRVETFLARGVRYLATPRDVRGRPNPIEASEAAFNEGLEHFADHCATCHANDGGGDTAIGRNLYPPAPDMRTAQTQNLSDGELFSIIENGIRFTGMPAWGDGTPASEQASWVLVHFIRRIPKLTAEDLNRMKALNPRTPAEFRAEEAARTGKDAPPAPPHSHTHAH
jgi:mono/diheme cytochrome c family protein